MDLFAALNTVVVNAAGKLPGVPGNAMEPGAEIPVSNYNNALTKGVKHGDL